MTVTVQNRPQSRLASVRNHWKPLAAVFAILTCFAIYLVNAGSNSNDRLLDTSSVENQGAAGYIHLLKARGYDVNVVRNGLTIESALNQAGEDTTVMVSPDAAVYGRLGRSLQRTKAGRVVLLAPSQQILSAAKVEADRLDRQAAVSTSTRPECSSELTAPVREVPASLGATSYEAETATTVCFPTVPAVQGVFRGGLLVFDKPNQTTIVLGTVHPLTNSYLATKDSAALGLSLVKGTKKIVWIDPKLADFQNNTPNQQKPSNDMPSQLSWMNSLKWWALFLIAMVGLWQGRRLGRIVTEYLPVMVKSSETARGLGRMYSGSKSYERSLELLQSAASVRISKLLGVHPSSTQQDLIAIIAQALGRNETEVSSILCRKAKSAADLVAGTANLDSLEHQVKRLVSPDENTATPNRTTEPATTPDTNPQP